MKLEPNKIYKRSDIQDFFGGQRQGGISTPSIYDVILLFSSEEGNSYGYLDGWTEDGYYLYTGEGQVGDMTFSRGNLAIRDHETNHKRLLLFIYDRRAYVRYIGEMRCVDHEYFLTPDRDGNRRNGIRFQLELLNDSSKQKGTKSEAKSTYKKPTTTERKGLITSRVGQGYYRQEILHKFNRKCAVTGVDTVEVLIASHIVPWRESTDEERLDVENGMLLSPNYDALFDKHLIGFNSDGKIVFSSLLHIGSAEKLGIDPQARITVSEGMKAYLARHLEKLR